MAPMDQDRKHKCKLCSKSFPCGRSLGGHMRSHVSSMGDHGLGNGYGLRENPKKTWRLSDHDGVEKEGSWSCGSGGSGGGGGDGGADSEGAHALVRVPRKKRQPRRPAEAASPSVSDKEQEDVAISLMMLSRDAGCWGVGHGDSSDKNSTVFDEFKKPKSYRGEFDESDSESRKSSCVKKKRTRSVDVDDGYGAKSGKSRYECSTCKKSFHSYQALGGHRASHKRLKGCCDGESSLVTDASVDQGKHQCSICGKVFASGQSLGGHKRTHLVMSSPKIEIEEEEEEEEAVVTPDLLDLNLPAPVDEDSSNGRGSADADGAEFGTWWAGCDLQSEAMIGMIANQ